MTDLAPGRAPTGVAGETVPFDAAWAAVRDALLRGLTHALSNRVMAIATLAELESVPGPDGRAGDVLMGEARRLDTLLHQFRMLCSVDPSSCEAVHLGELLTAVVGLAARHPEAADLPCTLDVEAAAEPAWGDPVWIQRAVLTLLTAATRAARRLGANGVRLRVRAAGRATVVSAGAEPGTARDAADVAPPAPGAYLLRAIEPPDGTGAWYELVLPTLTEARRRGA